MSRRDRDRDRDRERERERDRDRHRERERETREPDTKRRRSGFDQLPPSLNGDEGTRKDEVAPVAVDDVLPPPPPRGFHDALPPDSGSKPEPAREAGPRGGEEEKKKEAANVRGNGESSRNEDPARPPRSRTYFQHDERSNAGQVGRSFERRASSDRQWRDSKDRSDRRMNSSAANDLKRRDEKFPAKRDGHSAWRHDGFFRMEAEQPQLQRKRPAFREEKMPSDSENADRAVVETARSSHSDRPASTAKGGEEKGINEPRPVDKSENPTVWGKRDAHRSSFSSRERYNNGNANYRGRGRFDARQGYHPSGTQGDKWKHDLFEEANKSPTLKNEEDKIAKLEQLLAS